MGAHPLPEMAATRRDFDHYDGACDHLIVVDQSRPYDTQVVGTYRIMTSELAQRDELYSNTEFDLSGLPDRVLRHGAEVGRACVAKEHRNGRVLQLLWRGIALYAFGLLIPILAAASNFLDAELVWRQIASEPS